MNCRVLDTGNYPRLEHFRYFSAMPVTVFANHALPDGIHLAMLFKNIQEEIDRL